MNTPAGQFVVTSNTKLAATLRVFEIPLPRHNPAVVAEVFRLSDLRRGKKDPKPKKRVFWNFEPHPAAAIVTKAFSSTTADADFEKFVDSLALQPNVSGTGLSPEKLLKLRALHSAAVAQACREVQHMKELLVQACHECPDAALWQVILNDDGSIHSMFPKAASTETKSKFFTK
jgi:hypothetical protein